jgi:tyrosyl-tRNA synthetase
MLMTLNPSPSVVEPTAQGASPQMTAEPQFKSTFLQLMQERGYIHQITHPEELDEAASSGVITGYIGYDATAPSLHVGNLITIMMLRRLQQAGHKPIVIVGGGTTKVGDPSGKDETRQLRTHDEIQANIASQKQAFSKFLTFGDGPTDAMLVDNDEWLSKLGYIDFLREYGVHFTINRMLAFDSVKLRLDREQPLTFIEFNYMLMQATDFLELNRRYGCVLQMGGSDQWGNILNGVELIRRVDHKPAFGLTTPLLSTASGAKMGKTAQGAVWLNADMRSPYDYWQFWRNARTPTSAGSCGCSPTSRWTRCGGWSPCRARRSTTPRRRWPMRPPPCCTAKRRPRRRATPPRRPSNRGRCRPTCRRSSCRRLRCWGRPWRRWRSTPASALRAARPGAWPRAAACG